MDKNRRQKKAGNLIREEVSEILKQSSLVPQGEKVVTIRKVDVSPDMQWADTYISVFPEEEGENYVEDLKENVYELQQKLNSAIELKHVPKLRFHLDESLKKAKELNKMIDKLDT